jgi:quinol-cytochrome oxidoreductase complex cytochrome b subunit
VGTYVNITHRWAVWLFVYNACLLGWIGAQSPQPPFIIGGALSTFLYFFSIYLIAISSKLHYILIDSNKKIFLEFIFFR